MRVDILKTIWWEEHTDRIYIYINFKKTARLQKLVYFNLKLVKIDTSGVSKSIRYNKSHK